MTRFQFAILLAVLFAWACQKPIPFTPEQRRDWSPEQGATDYPAGAARDAGADR